jgi:hypothetical protein
MVLTLRPFCATDVWWRRGDTFFDRKIPEMSDFDGPSEAAASLRLESIDLCVLAPGSEF